MQDNAKGGKLPYLKQIIILIGVSWLVAALTSGFVLDVIQYLIEAYTASVRQYGWYTLTGAVVISVATLVAILVREVRKDM